MNEKFSIVRTLLHALPHHPWQFILIILDTLVVLLAVWFAYVLRFESLWPLWIERNIGLFPLAVGVSIPIFWSLGFYRSVVRYINGRAFYTIIQGVSISLLSMIAIWVFLQAPTVPRSVWVNFWIVAVFFIGGTRLLGRSFMRIQSSNPVAGQRVAIYGAGEGGVQLAMALQHSRELRPVVFLDDKQELQGKEILGLKVYAPHKLSKLIPRFEIAIVLLAMPSVSRSRRRQVIDRLEPLPVRVMVMPGLAELASGDKRIDDVREVDVEDILGRDTVQPNRHLLGRCITGKSVMVTGAGGSIGSELCLQIVRQKPKRLVLFEMSEFALYQIECTLRELIQQLQLPVDLVAILGSVRERERVQAVMEIFKVDTVYHAAAYKHVPIVEQNIIAGVNNNIFGTYHAALSAHEAGVKTFVLVSSDKAVRPINVMGATKRFAEVILQALAQRSSRTRYCMVRFGNVLASSGSVVQVFRSQIRSGGPITVTHPEVVRYFMTITEAAQLVIQASAMAQGGDMFVLNMGEPVKIVDLARRMIHLSGLEVRDAHNPDGDIEIRFSKLRPGERLFEELLTGENDFATDHPMIMRTCEESPPWSHIEDVLRHLEQAVDAMDCQTIRFLLAEVVSNYPAQGDIEDRVWLEQMLCRVLPPASQMLN
jgi:FlaA1/EpsC-like NDP-sugar epimerase